MALGAHVDADVARSNTPLLPEPALPRGGGAIRGMDEQILPGGFTGTAGMSLPLPLSPGRSGFGPALSLTYSSGAGTGAFGWGWTLSLGGVTRKTSAGLPTYEDDLDLDLFVLDGTELTPVLAGQAPVDIIRGAFTVRRYRPRYGDDVSRIERWTRTADGIAHWRVIDTANTTSYYGDSSEARISDPAEDRRVFSWLPTLVHDHKGNAMLYRYKAEDGSGVAGVFETARAGAAAYPQRYLKRILWANDTPFVPGEDPLARNDWLLEAVFDYGEHSNDLPGEAAPWLVRADPTSNGRPGFDLRSWRLAQRLLMFHRFPALGPAPLLVRSLAFGYRGATPDARRRGEPQGAFLASMQTTGYAPVVGGGTDRMSLPALTLTYKNADVDGSVGFLTRDAIKGLAPMVADGSRFVDLHGEALPGILVPASGGWHYHANRGGRFEEAALVDPLPAFVVERQPVSALLDLDGDGPRDVVLLEAAYAGWHRQAHDGAWAGFLSFDTTPEVDWSDSQLRFVDLTGDGRLDVLQARDDGFFWYRSRGAKGFEPGRFVPHGEEGFSPRRLFTAEAGRAVLLADMTGDGLADIVEIRAHAVSYWPNLGYGRFGARVRMGDSPALDGESGFDPARLRLADLDGDGASDLVYLGKDGVDIVFNASGNRWRPARRLTAVPPLAEQEGVFVVDLFGRGTACLVWPEAGESPLAYVDLMGSSKPHLLTEVDNGFGRKVLFEYLPSTQYFLDDLAAGTPWKTKLPMVVHCLSRLTVRDAVRETERVSRYAYHNGLYDPVEGEFAGFGGVDQRDAETIATPIIAGGVVATADRSQPPVLTRLWHHLGVPDSADFDPASLLDDAWSNPVQPEMVSSWVTPMTTDPEAYRQAARALRGKVLRSEVIAEGDSAGVPFSTTVSCFRVDALQPTLRHYPGAFRCIEQEAFAYAYERDPADPRVTQSLILKQDDKGLVTRSARVIYGRATADMSLPAEIRAAQAQRTIFIEETDYSNDVSDPDVNRLRVSVENRGFELTGVALGPVDLTALTTAIALALPLAFEAPPTGGLRMRLLRRTRSRFLADDLSGPLPFGVIEALGLLYESYQLAFTPSLVASGFGGRVSDAMLLAGGYVRLAGDADWWIPSPRPLFDAGAPARFYLPLSVRDALGAVTSVVYDVHTLMSVSATDPLGNVISAVNDYRTLTALRLTDVNGTSTAIAKDALGMVVATAITGPNGEGDTLADPTTHIDYQLTRWRDIRQPNRVVTRVRERHADAGTRWIQTYSYLDGGGAPLMSKVEAPPGLARQLQPDGTVVEIDTSPSPRWIGNGRTVLDNKGMPIRQYERYFSVTPEFESAAALVETGVYNELTYDPLGRAIRIDHPDGTFREMHFDTWSSTAWDTEDTVLDSSWYATRGSPPPGGPEPAASDARAAWLSAQHAATPTTIIFDALGRPVYGWADNSAAGRRTTRLEVDTGARACRAFDTRNRQVASTRVNHAGLAMAVESAERGERWVLLDVRGASVFIWDSLGTWRTRFDVAGRPVSVFQQPVGEPERRVTHIVWGDDLVDPDAVHARGRPIAIYDTAGAVTLPAYDFRGAPTSMRRRLTRLYDVLPDWNALGADAPPDVIALRADPLLEAEVFQSSGTFDALGRPVDINLPEGSTLRHAFDVSGRLSTLSARIRGAGPFLPFLTGQTFDAKGQRMEAEFGSGVVSRYRYDPLDFRLQRLLTLRRRTDAETDALQDVRFVYDAAGNPVETDDLAQQTRIFANAVVSPRRRFAYDALGQLLRAEGRELSAVGAVQPGPNDPGSVNLPHTNDLQAVRRYVETYAYDDLGNLLELRHQSGPNAWVRRYRYSYEDVVGDRTNRLMRTSRPGDPPGGFGDNYSYDPSGRITAMPHLASITWDMSDRMLGADLGGGGRLHNCYALEGTRVRKVVERPGGLVDEIIFLGPVELRRRRRGASRLERATLRIADETGPLAQVDTLVRDDDSTDPAPVGVPLVCYRHGDHAGAAMLETDASGDPIGYEEHHPFGTTAYSARLPGGSPALRRLRFHRRSLDEETGLYDYGARFYAPWLGRWISPDPGGFGEGFNLYAFCANNPVGRIDPDGRQSKPKEAGKYEAVGLGSNEGAAAAKAGPEAVAKYLYDKGYRFTGPVTQTSTGSFDVGNWLRKPGEAGGTDEGAWAPPDAEGANTQTGPPGDGGTKDKPAANDNTPPADGGKKEPPANDNEPSDSDKVKVKAAPGTAGVAAAQAAPGAEKFIWNHRFSDEGLPGTQRGRILEWMYGNSWRDNTAGYDIETATEVKQIKSTNSYDDVGNLARSATRDADAAIKANPTGTMNGKSPRAVIITPTDAPASVDNAVSTATNAGRGRKIPAGAQPPEHIRGLPGRSGVVGRGLTGIGFGLSAFSLGSDIANGDVPMGIGDALGVAGGGLELYAIAAPGAAVAGVSAMTLGIAVGGVGLAVVSGVSAYRAYKTGDTAGAIAGGVGVGAGLAIAAGAIGIMAGVAAAPVVLAVGLVAALGVGLFHLGRWLDFW